MTHEELVAGLKALNAPDQGMNYFGGGVRNTDRRYDERTGERLMPRVEAAHLSVYGDRARFLYRLIESADEIAEALSTQQAVSPPEAAPVLPVGVREADIERAAQALVDYFWDGSQPGFDRKPASWKMHYVGAVKAILSTITGDAPKPCIICNGTGERSGPRRTCGACNGSGTE